MVIINNNTSVCISLSLSIYIYIYRALGEEFVLRVGKTQVEKMHEERYIYIYNIYIERERLIYREGEMREHTDKRVNM